ncbi:MAG TPA: RNA methyltransferase PUA domain-containing protein, partial [Anaerolineaceae bacterium]|nr:RNA methyltransferase PUA domain-containing protein [Anaerolineaceae bacterium]
MHRFFISPEWIHADRVELPDELAHQIRQVLHLRVGDQITVLDDRGVEYQVKLNLVSSKLAAGQIFSQQT